MVGSRRTVARRRTTLLVRCAGATLLVLAAILASRPAFAEAGRQSSASVSEEATITVVRSALVNLSELAAQERLRATWTGVPPPRPRIPSLLNESEAESEPEPGAEGEVNFPPGLFYPRPPTIPFIASPSPTGGFMGLDDIPMVDSSYVVIPPDVAGGVGPTKVMCGFNNNYRIQDKATGATQVTLGTATFWNPVITNKALLNQLTDPRIAYDPIQGRWILAMQTTNTNGLVLFAVSVTSDPAGSYFLYAATLSGSYLIDFPILGFNKNWICVSINKYTTGGAFSLGAQVVADYAAARAGTLSSVSTFNGASGTRFCASPCVTLSATEDTLFLVTHLSSAGATYQVDRIVGTPAAPVYVSGGTNTRPGGGWTQPNGNLLPQSAPNSGSSACGATPCPLEAQDSQVRSAPTYRVDATTGKGFIYYTQTVQLSASTRTGVQWTKITAGTTPAFAEGGRIEDPTATGTNGGKWYAFPHIAVNANGDFIVGYTQLSSAQHPSAGYSVHLAGDVLSTIRDPQIYHGGEDYYHKTYTTTTGRNRWGDFSTAQVDPSDDMTLWTLQEYAKTRTGTDDGNTGSNASRWSSWWANLSPPSVTIDAGPSQNETDSNTHPFGFTVRLAYAYGLPITVQYHTSDGSATAANDDYLPITSSVVIPAGSTTGPISVSVKGDTNCEPNETFSVDLTSASNNIPLGATVSSTATIFTDDQRTIAASAGTGGTIAPSGSVPVLCSTSQGFTITPDLCHAIADLVVDNVSQGPLTSFSFPNVTANHTIVASFVELISVGESHTQVSCNGGADGTIDITATGGTPPFTFLWSDGPTNEDRSGLAAGSYTVTATDANACPKALTIVITEPPVLSASESHVNLSTCGGTDGSIDLTVSGGTPPYGYTWSSGATTQDISGLGLGTYTVTVTDDKGCTAGKTVAITAPGAPTLGEAHFNVSCNGGANGSVDLTVNGGTGPFTYAWSNGATTQDLGSLGPGTYNVTVTDANACTALLGVTVTEPAVLALSQTHVNVCTGGTDGSIDLTVAGGTEPYGYSWSNGATTQDLTDLAAGTYNVTVTDANSCTQGLGVTITVSQHAIVATAGSGGTISPPGTTTVACGAGQTYTITPDPGHAIASLLIDASPVTPAPSYTFTNVTAPHTIDVTFAAVTAVAQGPAELTLGAVVPNPTRGAVQMRFGLPSPTSVRVSIIDLQGRELAVLADGEYPAGWHTAVWDGRTAHDRAGAGLYFVRYCGAGHALMRKFVVTR